MAAFICRMCGGVLKSTASGVCRCEYCGNMQSIPHIDEDDKAELCVAAERFRREYQYDKAIEIYERLLKIYPTDADLYWSMLLCRYGVEYHNQDCMLNRTHPRSLLADEDFRTALKYATSEQRSLMESQAAEIDRIRRAIVEAAMGCKEYDVYLCCKESDESGRRTKDSAVAADLYKKLTNEKIRVFYTQKTLEDTLASEWEQHIYSALNSAKVMVIVGADKESFDDIWVKNAWVRYLTLANGERKVVIPVFRNFNASELPVELSHFQAVDMAKLGFESDLVSSVKSIISADNTAQSPATSVKDDSVFRRAYVHLYDSEFSEVNVICGQLLKTVGEHAEIYLLKLLAEYKVTSENALDTLSVDFSCSENYRKAMQLGDEGFRIKLREHNNRSVYNKLIIQLASAESEKQLRDVAEGFRALGEYADSSERAMYAESRVEQLKEKSREEVYALCVKHLNESTDIDILKSVKQSLKKLGDYKDCAELAVKCDEKIKELTEQKYYSIFTDKKSFTVKIKPILLAIPLSLALFIVCLFLFSFLVELGRDMGSKSLVESSSSSELSSVGDLSSSDETVALSEEEKKYREALSLLENGQYDEAVTAFSLLGNYSDSAEKALQAKYQKADNQFQNGQFDDAELTFTALGNYSDSAERIIQCKSEKGKALFESGELDKAESIFLEIKDTAKLNEVRYKKAELLVKNGSYEQASEVLASLGGYPDKLQLLNQCNYHKAKQYVNAKDYENAIKLYEKLGGYSDSSAQLWNARYAYALNLVEKEQYSKALTLLDKLGNGSDVQKLKIDTALKVLYNGENFTFGSYEQDGNTANGKEPINWIVMGRVYDTSTKTSSLCLISEKVLDVKSIGSSTWDNSSLRSWLNNEFYNTTFSSFEKEYLLEYSYYPSRTEGGNIRVLMPYYDKKYVDKVFVPQASYIEFYMNDSVTKGKNIPAAPTKAVQTKLGTSANKVEWWCVSEENLLAYSVDTNGNYIERQGDNCKMNLGVRPVIVITIS